jgi:hypothetical protein
MPSLADRKKKEEAIDILISKDARFAVIKLLFFAIAFYLRLHFD